MLPCSHGGRLSSSCRAPGIPRHVRRSDGARSQRHSSPLPVDRGQSCHWRCSPLAAGLAAAAFCAMRKPHHQSFHDTTAASSSHARREPANAQSALLMARDLLLYRPADDLYKDWLDRIVELISTSGEAPVLSRSLPPLQPQPSDVAHGAPPPPLRQDVIPEPRCEAPSATRHTGRPRAMKKVVGSCSSLRERRLRS